MNQGNLARKDGETQLEIGRVELEPWSAARADWIAMVERAPDATVFHTGHWIDAILRAYRFRSYVATLRNQQGTMLAGVPLAQSSRFWRSKLVAFPYSDFCAPLEEEPGAAEILMARLAAKSGLPPIEVRGFDAAAPWHKFAMFERWTVNTEGTAEQIQQRFSRNFRAHIRRAEISGFEVKRVDGAEGLRRFYELIVTSRMQKGLPTQPPSFFKTIADGMGDAAQIWFTTHAGRDLAVEFALTHRDWIYGKWMARAHDAGTGATEILIRKLILGHLGTHRRFDVGRTDMRNKGLVNFKRQHGGEPSSLPYVFTPNPPGNISSEHDTGSRALAMRLWPKLPRPLAEGLSAFIYRYLS